MGSLKQRKTLRAPRMRDGMCSPREVGQGTGKRRDLEQLFFGDLILNCLKDYKNPLSASTEQKI